MNELRRFEPARAPEGLRIHVLARAREAVASSPAPSRADRIFYSSRWRLAWIAAVAALVLIESLAVPGANGSSSTAFVRESDAAAQALGLAPGVRIGARVVAGDDSAHELMENAP